jgi:hypothetical protein
VLDAALALVWQQQDIPFAPFNQTVTVAPGVDGVAGRIVVLLFTGHEDTQCGGFAELRVFAERAIETG